MRTIARFLFNPWTIGIAGIAAVSLVIWYVGPLIAIGDVRPLESARVRWILIAVVALLWLARRLWQWYKVKRANKQLMDGLTKAPAAAATPTESEQEMKVLAERFDQAVETLRKLKMSSTKGGFSSLLARTGRQYLYELPWYVFIGPPGSGKTTALINSGLKFPLAEKLGTQAVKGVGGTRNCDWWFTDEAVLIDTAGRYTTQDSDAQVDKSAWDNFLVLLKRFRPRRPINGILLIMSAGDLLTQSARERAAHAEAARARIQELYERLAIRFPVYVLITKTDLMAGFTEFFADLGKEERAQVWGTTFAFSQEPNAPDPLPTLDAEWAALVKRIIDRLPQRMREERDLSKRALIFGFPQQVAALRASVADFLGQVFVTSRYGAAPMLRGVYLTSGTQEGRPIDRVIGNIARAFGFDGTPLGMQAAGSGRSYFLTKLLGDVIFEEQALAGTNLKWERRRMLLQWAGYAACAVLAVGLIAAWTISWSRNKTYVAQVDQHASQVREHVGQLSAKADTNVVALLPVLDQVKMIPVTEAILDGVPLSMRYGLYQGDKLTEGTNQVYRSLLRNTFLPRLIYRLEDQLRSAAATDLELTYEALKAYLMLQDRTHLDPDAVAAWIGTDWEVNLPRDVTAEQRAALDGHLKELLALEDFKSPIAADEQLIGRARATLAQFPLPQRVYSRLKRTWTSDEYPDFTVAAKGGPSAALVFQRTSGRPLSQGVSGLYSYDGYHNAFLQKVGEVSKQLSTEESWVLGIDKSAQQQAQALLSDDQVAEQVRRLYLQDYVRVWDEFINDIRLKQPATLSESIQTARTLSAPDSPVPVLMKALVRETTLTTKQEAEKDITDKAEDKLAEKKRQLAQMFGASGGPKPAAGAAKQIESIVDDHFAALRAWVQGGGEGPSPMDGALKLVNDVYLMLSAAETV
ncbi:MAG TPA: type VI secretion system membrane subunit TssM, partial [Nevskiaceae bacterium]|nr:type VI secretion system membrane subunit TssM [Nevskiaceae bacterium]